METAFLEALVGRWHGRAVETPRGPLPYDIHFQRGADGAVTGVANPGAARHHWRFYIEDGRPRLIFLTTFRGNDQPIHLIAETLSNGVASFPADDPSHLTVQIETHRDAIDIRVRLRGEPHVRIRLTRSSAAPTSRNPAPRRLLKNTCLSGLL